MNKHHNFKNFLTPIILILIITLASINFNQIKPFNSIITSLQFKNSSLNEKNNNKNNILMDYIPTNTKASKNRDIKLYVGGFPIGIRMNTEGVLVVGFSDIEIKDTRLESPGRKAGIEIGDTIIKIDGKRVLNSKELQKVVNECKSDNLTVEIKRDDKTIERNIKTILSSVDNSKKIGLWVRDSTAGVGTLTFYDKESNIYGALGHPITDADTNSVLKVRNGEVLDSSIIGVKKGAKGAPGELKGIFINENDRRGNIDANTYAGIYGKLDPDNKFKFSSQPMQIMERKQVKEGKAKILTTIDENGPRLYDAEIIKVYNQDSPDTKSMVIKVTDKRLLDKTGGIVQGMSGSPIIQDDKLVGAVTHVLVNRADVGYGIYIEWMLEEAHIIN